MLPGNSNNVGAYMITNTILGGSLYSYRDMLSQDSTLQVKVRSRRLNPAMSSAPSAREAAMISANTGSSGEILFNRPAFERRGSSKPSDTMVM